MLFCATVIMIASNTNSDVCAYYETKTLKPTVTINKLKWQPLFITITRRVLIPEQTGTRPSGHDLESHGYLKLGLSFGMMKAGFSRTNCSETDFQDNLF